MFSTRMIIMFLVLGNLLFVSFRQCITVIRFGFYDIQNNQDLGKRTAEA